MADDQPMKQEICFCTSPDGTRIAYAVHGQGTPLVRASTDLTNLEYDWNSPVWRHWLRDLGQHFTMIRHDQRGCGLSDWDVENLSLESWGRDNPAFRQVFTTLFLPEGTPEQIDWFNDLQQKTTSAENAVKMETAFYDINVSESARKVTAPTLVLHPREDRYF